MVVSYYPGMSDSCILSAQFKELQPYITEKSRAGYRSRVFVFVDEGDSASVDARRSVGRATQ